MGLGFAKFVLDKFGKKRAELDEVAAVCTRLASGAFRMPAYTSDDLLARKGFSIYDEMQKDAQVRSCLNTKKFAVLSRGWDILPASDEMTDVEIAQFVKFCLEDMRGSVQDVLFNVLDAIAKGFSVAELNWKIIPKGRYAGMIGIESIKPKDPQVFGFDMDEFLNIRQLVMALDGKVIHLPVDKFILYTYMPEYGVPYGQSDLRTAYKHWWSKEVILKFWNVYLEKFGMPTAKGAYRRGLPKSQQDELLRVLDKIQQETAIIVPEDVTVELLEAHRNGEGGYLAAVEFHNKQIAKAILGQTLTSDEGTRVGSLALAKVHLDVLGFYLEKLRRDLEETVMREQVIRRLVDFNFDKFRPGGRLGRVESGHTRGYPRFVLGRLDQRDLEAVGSLVVQLVNGKIISPDEPWIREYLGVPHK
jgi:phage gp29-like protein